MTSAAYVSRVEAIRGWAVNQVGAAYVYGATGALCTPSLRRDRAGQYPQQAEDIKINCLVLRGDQAACAGCRQFGRSAFDCAGFTRQALGTAGISLPSGASSQWLWTGWARKGPLGPEAKTAMCLLFRTGDDPARPMAHVGLSLGDGRVVDARSHKAGVVLTRIGDYPWTHQAFAESLEAMRGVVLALGTKGQAVRAMQQLLIDKGYALPRYGADGAFGQETLSALNNFQRRLGLVVTAWADEDVLNKLEMAPAATASVDERLQRVERLLAALMSREGSV